MKSYVSSVSPKGQITIPQDVRRQWGLKARDRVAIEVVGDTVTISPARSRLDAIYQSVPPLASPRTWKEVTELAAEEYAAHAAGEGLRRD